MNSTFQSEQKLKELENYLNQLLQKDTAIYSPALRALFEFDNNQRKLDKGLDAFNSIMESVVQKKQRAPAREAGVSMGMFELKGNHSKKSSDDKKVVNVESEGHVEDYFDANKSPFQNMNEEHSLGDNSFLVTGIIKKKQVPLFNDEDDLEGMPHSNESGLLGNDFRISKQYFKNQWLKFEFPT